MGLPQSVREEFPAKRMLVHASAPLPHARDALNLLAGDDVDRLWDRAGIAAGLITPSASSATE